MKKLILLIIIPTLLAGCSPNKISNQIANPIPTNTENWANDVIETFNPTLNKNNLISTYSTTFDVNDLPRKNNIALATNKINGYIIKPDQVFSFNEIVGPRTVETGYEMSTVFVYEEKVKGIGGGICQVSGTLYNSAVYANLSIKERHHHKRKVYYVPEGRDATVAYGKLDLKIKNTNNYSVKINAYTHKGTLTVEFYKC